MLVPGALALGCPLLAALPAGTPADRLARLIAGALLGALAFAGVLRTWRRCPPEALPWVVGLAVLARLGLLALPAVLSEDLYRYVWDGRLQHLGFDPFAFAPADPALDAAVAAEPALVGIRDGIGHAQIPTIYPPGAQLAFFAATAFGPSPLLWRLLATVAELGAAWGLARWLRAEGRDPRAVVLWLLCPLPALESAVGGHVDALGVLGLAWAGALTGGPAAAGARLWGAGAAFALAVQTKLFPLLALPRLGLKAGAACLATCAAMAWPYLGSASNSGLAAYGHRWRGNEGAFGWVLAGFERLWPAPGPPVDLPAWAARAGRWLVGPATTLGTPEASAVAPLWPDEAAFAAAKAVVGLVLGLVVLERLLRAREWKSVLGPVTAALLLLSPIVHPWYLLWWLPFAVRTTAATSPGSQALSWPLWVWSVTVWLAYLPRVEALKGGAYAFPPWLLALEHLPVWIALACAVRATVKPRRPPRAADGPL